MSAPVLLQETPLLRATARLDRSAASGAWGEVLCPNGGAWLVEIHRKAGGGRRSWTYTATLEAAREFAREVLQEEEEGV